MRDTFFDCPERERAQWWGDETLLMGECFYTTDMSTHALMKKGMHELIAWQRSDGSLFSPIHAGNYDSELPGQSPDGKPVSRENWKISFVDSEDSEDGNHSGEKVYDLQESTYWKSAPAQKCPHWIVIEMESNIPVTGFRYLPRAESVRSAGMVYE